MSGLAPIVLFTVEMAALATLIVVPVGTVISWALSRGRWPGRILVETLVSLPLVLPPTAVGFALLLLLDPSGPLGTVGSAVVFSWRAVVLAGAVVGLPLLVGSFRHALEAVDPRLVGVARTLGRRPWRVFLEVELPLAWRGLAAGALLAFARALGEFGATILLAGNIPGRTQTLALALYQAVELGHDGEALSLAALAGVLALVLVGGADWLGRRRSRRIEP